MAASKIKIVQGNDLPLCKKLTTIVDGVITPVAVSDMSELKVLYGMGQKSKAEEVSWWASPEQGTAIIHFRLESTQIEKLGTYNIWIVGKYGINDVVVSYGAAVDVIEWSAKSTAGEYIYTEEQALDDSIFIPAGATDEELERLKQVYEEKIEQAEQAAEEAEQAKAEYIEKMASIDDIAKETAATQNKDEIIQEVRTAQPDLSQVAKESTATANTAAIISEIRGHAVSITYDENNQAIIINTARNDEQSE